MAAGATAASSKQLWEVVGGQATGGILARQGQDLKSPELETRLQTGAWVAERQLVGERLHFAKVSGDGPDFGWVSIKIKGKELLLRRAGPAPGAAAPGAAEPAKAAAAAPAGQPSNEAGDEKMSQIPADDGEFNPYVVLQIPPNATDQQIKKAYRQASLRVHPDRNPDDPEAANKFREVEKSMRFLLNPLKRLFFNRKKGYAFDITQRPIWWSGWQEMFDELGDPELEDIKKADDAEQATGDVDILILGCTALTGMLGCDWLSKRPEGLSWMMAGRTPEKVKAVHQKFGKGPNYRGMTIIREPKDLEEILPRCKLVISYLGPPRSAGVSQFLAASIKHGVHWIDINGDMPLVRDNMARLNEEAKEKGVIVMPCIGFTALPCDLVVHCAIQRLRGKFKTECKRARVYTWAGGGGMSGATFQSGLEGDKADPEGAEDPYSLGGMRKAGLRPEDQDFKNAEMDGMTAQWVGPDSLQSSDTRIVRLSCALFEQEKDLLSYGRNFQFSTRMLMPNKHAASLAVFSAKLPMKLRDKLVDQKKVPPMGSGPPERMRQESTHVKICNAEGENGKEVHAIMRGGPGGLGDGYHASGLTALLAAHCILEEPEKLPKQRRGFVTAAYLLGETSIFERLAAESMSFEVHDGRVPQDTIRNIVGGHLAIETDKLGISDGVDEDALKARPELLKLPWDV